MGIPIALPDPLTPASRSLFGLAGLATTGISGDITFTKPGTTAQTYTFPNSSGTVALLGLAQTWTAAQAFRANGSHFFGVVATTGLTNVTADGGNSGTNGGASFFVRGNGATTAAWGNFSSILGGTYDARTTIYSASSNIVFQHGASTVGTWDTSGNLGLAVTPTAGNGLLQFIAGTSKAHGIGFGPDLFLYRTSAGNLTLSPSSGAGQLNVYDSTFVTQFFFNADSTQAFIGTGSSKPLRMRTNNIDALIVDTSQGITTAAAVYAKNRLVAATAGTTALDASDHIIFVTGATTHTLTLPAASNGRRITIKNRSTGTVTVNRAGSDQIEGGTTTSVTAGNSLRLEAFNTDWNIC